MEDHWFKGRITTETLRLKTDYGELQVPIAGIEKIFTTPRRRKVDLLSLFSPLDRIAGRWRRDGRSLVAEEASLGRLRLRYDPPIHYVLNITLTPLSGPERNGEQYAGPFVAITPLGGRQAQIMFNTRWNNDGTGPFSGIHYKDNEPFLGDIFHEGPVLHLNQTSKIKLLILTHEIRADIDGKLLFVWRGDLGTMGFVPRAWDIGDRRFLGIGANNTSYRFDEYELTPIDAPPRRPRVQSGQWLVTLKDGGEFVAQIAPQSVVLPDPEARQVSLDEVNSYRVTDDQEHIVQLRSGEALTFETSPRAEFSLKTNYGEILVPMNDIRELVREK
jgi:hypothetical protein